VEITESPLTVIKTMHSLCLVVDKLKTHAKEIVGSSLSLGDFLGLLANARNRQAHVILLQLLKHNLAFPLRD
jgi:hypothetical protein